MENKNIIIILVAIIIVLAAVLGVMYLQINSKEPSKIKITSNNTLHEGEDLSVKLTDLNGTSISKQNISITITNSKGKVVVNETVKTKNNGKAKLELDLKKGKYNVSVSYGGNSEYEPCNISQKIKIVEEVAVEESSGDNEQAYEESSGSSSSDSESDGYWETSLDAPFEYHTEYDSDGGFRQYDRAGNLVGSSYEEDQDDIADYVPRRI